MRGVYAPERDAQATPRGSSPHARGLQVLRPPVVRRRGIIPACAGFTVAASPFPLRPGDHPRMRGVYSSLSGSSFRDPGSSPHARGLHPHRTHLERKPRIIPACAGFTPPGGGRTRRTWDHPRMRGVYQGGLPVTQVQLGSSPHARGLRRYRPRTRRSGGIIPACAGFTQRVQVQGDHGSGSSPHARGLPLARWTTTQPGRIIPACAGFTRR
mgnify:CR=1 FL=1